MHKAIRFYLWLIHKVSLVLLANAVAFGIPLLAFSIHITNPQILKDWFNRSNTYETLVNESLNLIELEATNASSDGSLGDTLASNPFVDTATVIDALRNTLTPEFIQVQAEGFIDGAYEWLDGETEIPNFEFSLAERNDQLVAELGMALKEEFANMPDCKPEEITLSFNLLENLCRPPSVNLDAEVDNLVAQLAGEEGLLSNATWTGEDLVQQFEGDSGLRPDQVRLAQNSFEGLKNGPMFLLIAGLVSIPIVFYSSRSQYRGFNEIGNTLFSGSLFTFIPAVIIARWENLITSLIGESGDNTSSVTAARALLEPFLETAVNDIASLTAWISGITLFIGTIMVVYGFYLKKIYQEDEEEDIAKELAEAKEQRRIKEVQKHAKKRARHTDLTVDPKTKKPLKGGKKSLSRHEARQIARDPKSQKKKISEL